MKKYPWDTSFSSSWCSALCVQGCSKLEPVYLNLNAVFNGKRMFSGGASFPVPHHPGESESAHPEHSPLPHLAAGSSLTG